MPGIGQEPSASHAQVSDNDLKVLDSVNGFNDLVETKFLWRSLTTVVRGNSSSLCNTDLRSEHKNLGSTTFFLRTEEGFWMRGETTTSPASYMHIMHTGR